MNDTASKTIVVPFDYSESSMSAIDTAIEMAGPADVIHVVHVVVPTAAMVAIDMPHSPPEFDRQRFVIASDRLKKTLSDDKYSRLNLSCQIGDVGWEIVDFASNQRADLIIMPTHGRTGLTRLMMGSVAERVMRLATCPVLILPTGK
jgi:nucleotide-binding universal stress UspA family protein